MWYRGSAHESIVPYQAFECADGLMYMVGAGNDKQVGSAKQSFIKYVSGTSMGLHEYGAAADDAPALHCRVLSAQFEKLSKAVGMPELSSDPRFVTNRDRTKHRKELVAILQKAFKYGNDCCGSCRYRLPPSQGLDPFVSAYHQLMAFSGVCA